MAMIKPLFDRVLLRREQLKHETLIIPDQAKRRNAGLKCEVLAVGPSVDDSIVPGMMVIVGQHAGTWIDEEGRIDPEGDYYIAEDRDILCCVGEANG